VLLLVLPLKECREAEKSRIVPLELPPECRPPPSIMEPLRDKAEPHDAEFSPEPELRDATSRIEPPATKCISNSPLPAQLLPDMRTWPKAAAVSQHTRASHIRIRDVQSVKKD